MSGVDWGGVGGEETDEETTTNNTKTMNQLEKKLAIVNEANSLRLTLTKNAKVLRKTPRFAQVQRYSKKDKQAAMINNIVSVCMTTMRVAMIISQPIPKPQQVNYLQKGTPVISHKDGLARIGIFVDEARNQNPVI